MSNVLAYKGYFAPVEFDAEQYVLTGMVAGIRNAIVFEGSRLKKWSDASTTPSTITLSFVPKRARNQSGLLRAHSM